MLECSNTIFPICILRKLRSLNVVKSKCARGVYDFVAWGLGQLVDECIFLLDTYAVSDFTKHEIRLQLMLSFIESRTEHTMNEHLCFANHVMNEFLQLNTKILMDFLMNQDLI